MSQQESKATRHTAGPTPAQLERLADSLRAAELAKNMAKLEPARPAETYGKIRDERSNSNRIVSPRQ